MAASHRLRPLNPDPGNNGSAKGPMRRVVRSLTAQGAERELLECGHLLPTQDVRNAGCDRRRCPKCKAALPAEIDPADFFRQPGDRSD